MWFYNVFSLTFVVRTSANSLICAVANQPVTSAHQSCPRHITNVLRPFSSSVPITINLTAAYSSNCCCHARARYNSFLCTIGCARWPTNDSSPIVPKTDQTRIATRPRDMTGVEFFQPTIIYITAAYADTLVRVHLIIPSFFFFAVANQ